MAAHRLAPAGPRSTGPATLHNGGRLAPHESLSSGWGGGGGGHARPRGRLVSHRAQLLPRSLATNGRHKEWRATKTNAGLGCGPASLCGPLQAHDNAIDLPRTRNTLFAVALLTFSDRSRAWERTGAPASNNPRLSAFTLPGEGPCEVPRPLLRGRGGEGHT